MLVRLRDVMVSTVVMNRNAVLKVVDSSGRERERYNLTYGALMRAEDGAKVTKGPSGCRVGPLCDPDHRRGQRCCELRRHGRGRPRWKSVSMR